MAHQPRDTSYDALKEELQRIGAVPPDTGFSTAEAVSDISGRGVGMDVVRRNIQDLGGRTSIKSEAGRGMSIQLALPLTLAVMDGMVVEIGKQTYVLPIPNIVECLRPSRNERWSNWNRRRRTAPPYGERSKAPSNC